MGRSHNITIARSGVQYYLRNELPVLGLTSIPRELNHLRVFGVYRPSYTIEQCADMFKKAPIVVGHQNWIGDDTDPSLVLGYVGDEVKVKLKNSEATVFSTLQFNDESYDDKESELSPGYRAKCQWAPGVSPDGVEFQIMSGEITEVNHLALVPKARGGDGIKILDGGGQMPRKILSGILRYARKMVGGIKDGLEGDAFKNTINDILENRGRWTDEEMSEHCETLSVLTADLPDSEEKEKLLRFIADIPLIKNEEDATATQVGETVVTLFEQLDTDADEDVVGNSKGEQDMEPVKEEEKKIPDALPGTEAAPAADAGMTPMQGIPPKVFTLEDVMGVLNEISASLAKMANAEEKEVTDVAETPAPAPEGTPEEKSPVPAEAPAKEEKPEEKIGDALPAYSQSLAATRTADSLEAAFASMKNKKRG